MWRIVIGRKIEGTLEYKSEAGCVWLYWGWRADSPSLRVAPHTSGNTL